MIKTDYNKLASTYDKRYEYNYLENIKEHLLDLISSNNYKIILEAGCGTGRWIKPLITLNLTVFGLDNSVQMLKTAQKSMRELNIVNADAVNFPFKDNSFDLIFCVNAFHHFPDKARYISECNRTISNSGMIAIIGVDPHIDKDWYVYNYFDSVYENDLKRFLSLKSLQKLLEDKKFVDIKIKVAEKIYNERIGKDVFNDPFLEKHHSSQLANLSSEEYEKGILKIKNQIEKNPEIVFKTSVIFYLVFAKKK